MFDEKYFVFDTEKKVFDTKANFRGACMYSTLRGFAQVSG